VLRYVYVLSLVIWLAAWSCWRHRSSTIFQVLQASAPDVGRALAGEAFGAMLGRFHYVAYGCGGVLLVSLLAMALLGPRPVHFAVRTALVAACSRWRSIPDVSS